MLTVLSDITGHHTPDETGQFSCDCGFCNVCFGTERDTEIFSAQSFVGPVRIGDGFAGVTFLAFTQRLGFLSRSEERRVGKECRL